MLKYTLKRALSVLSGRLHSTVDRGVSFEEEADEMNSKDEQEFASGPGGQTTGRTIDRRTECLRILELNASATEADIKASYRKLCKKYHPDRFANDPDKLKISNELFAQINEAYEYLK